MGLENLRLRQEKLSNAFFKKMVLTVFSYIIFYSAVYFFLNAKFSALMLFIGCVFFTPMILVSENKFPNAARFFFCVSAPFYVYGSAIGIPFPMHSEFYYFAALMCPVLVFDPNQKNWIISGMLVPITFGAFQLWGASPELSNFWVPTHFPFEVFKVINFLGAMGIMVLFLKHFMDRFHENNIEIAKSTEELEQFFHVAGDPLCIKSIPDGKFKKVNPAFAKILGYTMEELTSRPVIEFIHPNDLEETSIVIKQNDHGIAIKNFVNRYRCADGTYKYMNWSTAPDPDKGLVFAAARDITDLLKAEEEAKLEKAKALHNAKLASLGEMSAGIAHEINNPLAIISGSAELMQKHLSDTELIKSKTEIIFKATQRIAKIVNGLRKFSRSSEKKEYTAKSLNQILKEVVTLVEPQSKRYYTEISLTSSTDGLILCDEMEIEQVLINLINNSIDAIKGNHKRWIKISVFEDSAQIVIQIRDSGNGIDSKIAEKLFQPFFTTKPIGEGTGLGLSIVKGILDEHKASIELLQNDPNTCFELRFNKAS